MCCLYLCDCKSVCICVWMSLSLALCACMFILLTQLCPPSYTSVSGPALACPVWIWPGRTPRWRIRSGVHIPVPTHTETLGGGEEREMWMTGKTEKKGRKLRGKLSVCNHLKNVNQWDVSNWVFVCVCVCSTQSMHAAFYGLVKGHGGVKVQEST